MTTRYSQGASVGLAKPCSAPASGRHHATFEFGDLHPGHTVYEVRSSTGHLLVWGDTVHVPTLQFDRPNVAWEFDGDQPRARASRAALPEQLTHPHHFVAGAHLDSPGIARVTPPATATPWSTSPHRSADQSHPSPSGR